ncbi:outer membrane protein TolC [Povalibacter uvarum]|uniref:Outer membrane protein TolC n=1 Tax=Povalibacter uvarum TaxID=732238 RepID=A0A841HSH6_9GAMM|nr:TolC family protein [Povalibacter uvarum]MBB6094988.1 outer membrane protein TolC [Povalibacter uvarum]
MPSSFGRAVVHDSRAIYPSTATQRLSFLRCCVRAYTDAAILFALLVGVVTSPLTVANAAESPILELTEALRLAAADQPQIETLHLQEQSAREAAEAERELPDPKLAFGVQNLPATGPDSFRLDRDEMTMLSVGVMQDVVTREKRSASSARMTAEAARLAAEADVKGREIRRDAGFAWIDAFEAQQRANALRKLVTELSSERAVSAERLASSGERSSTVLALDMEIARTRDQLFVAQRDESRARASLARWIGEHAVRPLPEHLHRDLIASADPAKAKPASLDAHPLIQSTEHAIEVTLREADRARADRRPDWGWQLMYGHRQDLADMVSLQVTIGLPINRADRQDRKLAEKLAMATAARSDLADRRRELEAQLASARADLTASIARLREHQERLLPAARARLATAEAAYAGGSGQLPDVWAARREMVDVLLHHEMIMAEGVRALMQLEWLVGTPEMQS